MELRDEADPRRPGARPDHGLAGTADPPDDLLPVKDTEHAANLFALKELGNIYTRIMNPTQDAVEQKIAALEGGVGALLTASGMSATHLALVNLAEAGDHIVASTALYGGTINLLKFTLPKFGIEVSFVEDPSDLEQWRAAVRPNTKAFFGETIGNPKDIVLDIAGISEVAHAAGVPLVVDNTIATPTCSVRSSTARTSSCTPRRSTSAATAPRSPA